MISTSTLLGLGFLASEVGLGRWRRSGRTVGSRRMDASSLRVLWIVIITSIAVGVWVALLGIGPRLPTGFPWGVIGMVAFAAGTVLRWWAIYYLGRFFTVDVAVAADHQVVSTGPYRWVRHPSYSGLLLQFGGLALTFGSVLGFAVVVVPTFVALLYRIRVEEAALRASLGEPYSLYMQKTKRLIPLVF